MNIEHLKQAKKDKKLSYDDIAKLTGYSRSTITNIFCGYIEFPRHETVQAIERALGLAPAFTAEELAQGVGDYPVPLSQDDRNRIANLARADEVLGKKFVDTYLATLELLVEQKLSEKK